jgi:hypothetical protein
MASAPPDAQKFLDSSRAFPCRTLRALLLCHWCHFSSLRRNEPKLCCSTARTAAALVACAYALHDIYVLHSSTRPFLLQQLCDLLNLQEGAIYCVTSASFGTLYHSKRCRSQCMGCALTRLFVHQRDYDHTESCKNQQNPASQLG